MAIRISHGTLGPLVGLAKEAGEAKLAEQLRQEAAAERRQQASIAQQLQAREEERKQEMAEQELNAVLDKRNKLAAIESNRAWELEKFNRDKQWEIEKAQLKDKMEFTQEEAKKARRTQEWESGIEEIRNQAVSKGGNLHDDQIQKAEILFARKYPEIPEAATILGIYDENAFRAEREEKPLRPYQIASDLEALQTIPTLLEMAKEFGLDVSQITRGTEFAQSTKYSIGDIITHNGKKYKVIGFYPDGEPDVEPVE